MRLPPSLSRAITATAGLALGLALLAAPAASPALAAPALTQTGVSAACTAATTPGQSACDVLTSASVGGTGVQPTAPQGYGPLDLESAYGVQAIDAGIQTEGMLQTVALIEESGDGNAEADLGIYRSQYGLPPCTTASGCLQIVNQSGNTSPLLTDQSDAGQFSADLDIVSAICPNCHILVVEANDDSIETGVGPSVNEAVALGAQIIDIGYGGPEDPTETSWDTEFFDHPGVEITASAGLSGFSQTGLEYPAASPYVTSVGGTVLDPADVTGCTTAQAGARGWCESGWSMTTSGCSQDEPAPAWQSASTGCSGRADNDVSAVAGSTADPLAPIAIYDRDNGGGGWLLAGGTSAASAIVAAIYADAGTPGATDSPAEYPYEHPGGNQATDYVNPGVAYPYFDGLNDITSGSNSGSCTGSNIPLCTSGPGWDGITGLGSPAGTASFTAAGSATGPAYVDGISAYCMTNSGGTLANGNAIEVLPCNGGGNSQSWTFDSDGTFRIGSGGSYCLGVNGGGTSNGTTIILHTCDGLSSQQWKVQSSGQTVNENSEKCLYDPSTGLVGFQLVIEPCSSTFIPQNILLTTAYSQPSSSGNIKLYQNNGDCLDNSGGNLVNDNPEDIWPCHNGVNSQNWTVEPDGTIQLASTWCLTPYVNSGGNTVAGIEQCDGSGDQVWIIGADGTFYNPSAFGCLNAPNTNNGTKLTIVPATGGWSCGGIARQEWIVP